MAPTMDSRAKRSKIRQTYGRIFRGWVNANDDKVGGFDPLYPNLGAFTEAPLYSPTNQINAESSLSAKLSSALTLRLKTILPASASTGDASCSASGQALSNPPISDKISAALLEAAARWIITNQVELYGSIVRAEALNVVRAAGGRYTTYCLMKLTTRF